MADRSKIDQLDDLVTAILAGQDVDLTAIDSAVADLAVVSRELHGLPADDFKRKLQIQLSERIDRMSTPKPKFNWIPEGYPRVSPYLCYDDATAAIEFYKKAFGAEELMRLKDASGKIGHAELKIADAVIMMADEYPEYGVLSPRTVGGSPVKMHLWVEDVDAFAQI